jgi:hypothetical protein
MSRLTKKKGQIHIIEISGCTFEMECLEHFHVHISALHHYLDMQKTINKTTKSRIEKGETGLRWVIIEKTEKEFYSVSFWGSV